MPAPPCARTCVPSSRTSSRSDAAHPSCSPQTLTRHRSAGTSSSGNKSMSPRPPAPGHRQPMNTSTTMVKASSRDRSLRICRGSRAATFCDSSAPGHPNLWRTSTSLHRCANGGAYAGTVSPTTAHAASAATSVPQARGWRGHPLRGGCRLALRRSYAHSCSIILPGGAMVSSLREGCQSVEDSSASPISPSLQSPRQLRFSCAAKSDNGRYWLGR